MQWWPVIQYHEGCVQIRGTTVTFHTRNVHLRLRSVRKGNALKAFLSYPMLPKYNFMNFILIYFDSLFDMNFSNIWSTKTGHRIKNRTPDQWLRKIIHFCERICLHIFFSITIRNIKIRNWTENFYGWIVMPLSIQICLHCNFFDRTNQSTIFKCPELYQQSQQQRSNFIDPIKNKFAWQKKNVWKFELWQIFLSFIKNGFVFDSKL